mmetsp:Transcript_21445/g.22170  ORF Transcript_21445/g.22170 Transcript_21445/m.22170 type:complete len:257 (+) Transcript_21445:31-801(+)
MSKFATLDKIREKEEDDKKSNEYYAGGSDNRGGGSSLNVIGPTTSSSSSNNPYDKIINNAMNDAKEMNTSTPPVGSRKITLYRNGFTIDDGPLRDLESPENKQFLTSLSDGYIPRELQGSGKEVHIGLEDKRGEDYRAPTPPPYVAFSGDGNTLGGHQSLSEDAYIFATSSNPPPVVDQSKPTTLLQIKLQNGKKLKLKLNHTHTILDLATLIDQSEPFESPYTLSAGFPPRDIPDANLTLSEAGLIGAAITQKFI